MTLGNGTLAFLPGPGTVELREYPLRAPAPGEVLLRTLAAGVCGSEVHIFRGNHPIKSLALGHEIVGEVVATGGRLRDSAGEPLEPGQRVTAVYYDACGACRPCLRRQDWLCEHAYDRMLAGPDHEPHFVGTHATHYYVSPRQAIFRIPDAVPTLAAAAANCALAQVVCAVDRADLRVGETIVVQGAGGLGIYATAVAKERGARVIVFDAVESRLSMARTFGADEVVSLTTMPDPEQRLARVLELTDGEGADAVFEFAGVPEAFAEGLKLVRRGGRYLELGNVTPGVEVTIDVGDLTRRGATVFPINRYEPRHLHEALAFLARQAGRLPFERLIDGSYPLHQIGRALEDSSERKVTRAAVVFEP